MILFLWRKQSPVALEGEVALLPHNRVINMLQAVILMYTKLNIAIINKNLWKYLKTTKSLMSACTETAHYCLWSDYMHWKQNTRLSNKNSIWRPQTFVPLKRYKRRAGTLGAVLRSCLHHEVISRPWKTNIKACFRSCFAGLPLSSLSVSADTPDLISRRNSFQKAIL